MVLGLQLGEALDLLDKAELLSWPIEGHWNIGHDLGLSNAPDLQRLRT